MGWVRIMETCPFWSAGDILELCDKECPMIKCDDECIFQIYNADSEFVDKKGNSNKELVI